jgi:hypothetical protein
MYENGVLCHILERKLRLLDIHHSADQEIVVDIRKLLDEAILESHNTRKYKFQLLYHAHGIVSCLYTHAKPQLAYWLVVFHPSERKVITTRRLDSAFKIFVRNDSGFLYYGVQSDIGDDGFRRWVLQGFDFRKNEWLPDSLNLPDTVGSDIDSTICFEIIDGYFCVLANHTSFEMDRIEYTSYYDFFRFPLHHPTHEYMERPAKRNLFRRQHSEGTIDDRWSFMRIFKDELSGSLKILESRKEWLSGNSSATRTYYTKAIHIRERGAQAGGSSSYDEGEDTGDDQYAEDDRLAQYLGTATKSNKGRPPDRDPTEVHVGDDGSTSVMFTLSKCFIRSYHPSSQAFLDVVDDPRASEGCGQRIRIRAGSRRLRAQSELDESLMCSEAESTEHHQQHHATLRQQMDSIYEQRGIVSWPPDSRSPALDALHDIMNPPEHLGNVRGTSDERSLIYETGGGAKGGIRALVLVSFDPSIYLKGVRSFDDRRSSVSSNGDLSTTLRGLHGFLGSEKGKGKEKEIGLQSFTTLEEVIVENKSSASSGGSGLISQGDSSNGIATETHAWASYEPAQFLSIDKGYHFAKERSPA